jgi:hypothetical protein
MIVAVPDLSFLLHARSNVVPISKNATFRTAEQITEQLQERLEEMKAASEAPEYLWPCKTCRWAASSYCRNALVRGFPPTTKWNWDGGYSWAKEHAALCGPEKALWEPKRPWYRRIWDWFIAPWKA